MKIARGTLLAKLNEVQIGISSKENVAQSNCYVFHGDTLTTFNDSIMARAANPLPGIDTVVNATDLAGLLSKVPDEEVDISLKGDELRVKGKGFKAGITAYAEVLLPVDAVPAPGKWSRLGEGVATALQQAVVCCSKEDAQYLTTCVHVTEDMVEGCDNLRLLRVTVPTGFSGEVLLPAESVAALEGLELNKVSLGEGWCHFKTGSGTVVSLRSAAPPYLVGLDAVLEMEGPIGLVLPASLGEMIGRAEVFSSEGFNAKVGVKLAEGMLTLTNRKEGGWFKENKGIAYTGKPLAFEVHPRFLVEVLSHTREVQVCPGKMKLAYDRCAFVVCLEATESTEAAGDSEGE